MFRYLASLALALACMGNAFAAEDLVRYALTVPVLEKFKAANQDIEKVVKKKDDDNEPDQPTVEELARTLDTTPGVKPVLARHGFTSRSFSMVALAVLQAGFYLMMEPSMDKKKGAELLASYPSETRANIELLRKNPKLLK